MSETPRSSDDVENRPAAVDRAFACADCDARWYYDRHRCPACSGTDLRTYELGVGSVVAATTVEMTPSDVRAPNRLVVARFGEITLVAQAVDESVGVGDRVRFAGASRLREDDDREQPRLTPVE